MKEALRESCPPALQGQCSKLSSNCAYNFSLKNKCKIRADFRPWRVERKRGLWGKMLELNGQYQSYWWQWSWEDKAWVRTKSFLVCTLPIYDDQRTLNQQWVLIAEQHCLLPFPWLPNCPTKMCLVMTRHILVLQRHKICVLLCTLKVSITRSKICVWIILFSMKTHCWFKVLHQTFFYKLTELSSVKSSSLNTKLSHIRLYLPTRIRFELCEILYPHLPILKWEPKRGSRQQIHQNQRNTRDRTHQLMVSSLAPKISLYNQTIHKKGVNTNL